MFEKGHIQKLAKQEYEQRQTIFPVNEIITRSRTTPTQLEITSIKRSKLVEVVKHERDVDLLEDKYEVESIIDHKKVLHFFFLISGIFVFACLKTKANHGPIQTFKPLQIKHMATISIH